MHPSNTPVQSTRALCLLGLALGVYFLAHLIGSQESDVPRGHELVTITPQGRLDVLCHDQLEWYLTSAQRTDLTPEALERNKRVLGQLLATVDDQIQLFEQKTSYSSAQALQELRNTVAIGDYTDARATWNQIKEKTSPRTMNHFDPTDQQVLGTALAELEHFEAQIVASMARKKPLADAGFLWTTPVGSTFEVLGLSILGALLALTLRRRSLERRGLPPSSALHVYGIGVLLALLCWLLVRGSLSFSQVEEATLLIGLGFGLGSPLLGIGLARATKRDLTRELRGKRRSVRRARIVTAMKDLNPGSFAELKRTASQFATELASVEAEESSLS